MRRSRLFSLIACIALLGCNDPNDKANALFVDAAAKAAAATTEGNVVKRFELLTDAKRKADDILAAYPTTTVAVQISSNGKIGPYTKSEMEAALADLSAKPELCFADIVKSCFLDIIYKDIQRLWNTPANTQADARVINTALAGWLWSRIFDPRLPAVFEGHPKELEAYDTLAGGEYIPDFLKAIADVQGGEAALQAARSLAAIPALKAAGAAQTSQIITAISKSTVPDGYAVTKSVLAAFVPALTSSDTESLGHAFCEYKSYLPTDEQIKSNCSASDIATLTTYFPALPDTEWVRLYDAAPTEQTKQKIAKEAARHLSTPALRLQWYGRAGLTTNIYELGSLYDASLDQGDKATTAEVARLLAKAPDLDAQKSALPTQRAITLMFADGTLAQNLPAILAEAERTPYSDPTLNSLMAVYRYGLRIPSLLPQLAKTSLALQKTWSRPEWAINLKAKVARAVVSLGNDPKPNLDQLFGANGYDDIHDVDVMQGLADHGHPETAQRELDRVPLNAAPPNSFWSTAAFGLRMNSLNAKLRSGDTAALDADLASLSPSVRQLVLGRFVYQKSPYPILSDAQFDHLQRAFPREMVFAARTTGITSPWRFALDPDLYATTVCQYYDELVGAKADTPKWLANTVSTVSRPVQLKIIRTLFDKNDPNWVLAAARVALLAQPRS